MVSARDIGWSATPEGTATPSTSKSSCANMRAKAMRAACSLTGFFEATVILGMDCLN